MVGDFFVGGAFGKLSAQASSVPMQAQCPCIVENFLGYFHNKLYFH